MCINTVLFSDAMTIYDRKSTLYFVNLGFGGEGSVHRFEVKEFNDFMDNITDHDQLLPVF